MASPLKRILPPWSLSYSVWTLILSLLAGFILAISPSFRALVQELTRTQLALISVSLFALVLLTTTVLFHSKLVKELDTSRKFQEELDKLKPDGTQTTEWLEIIKKLGVTSFYEEAEESTRRGLESAKTDYWWLGTSAFYVLVSARVQEQTIERKRDTDFLFITVDPDCPAAVAAQAHWQKVGESEVIGRILETKGTIERLAAKGVNIKWECHSTFPTFRVVIVNRKKVLVSFYEQGKLGPEGEQLELDADGLLGKWFILFFEKSRADAKRMSIGRKAIRLLLKDTKIDKDALLAELEKRHPDVEKPTLRHIVDELKPDEV